MESLCGDIRDGSSVVVHVPGDLPEGFDSEVRASLGDVLRVSAFRATTAPLHDLIREYAESPGRVRTVLDLCHDIGFQDRLVRLRNLNADNWSKWRDFLGQYAHVSRSLPLLGRTLFLAPLAGCTSEDASTEHVGLKIRHWDGVCGRRGSAAVRERRHSVTTLDAPPVAGSPREHGGARCNMGLRDRRRTRRGECHQQSRHQASVCGTWHSPKAGRKIRRSTGDMARATGSGVAHAAWAAPWRPGGTRPAVSGPHSWPCCSHGSKNGATSWWRTTRFEVTRLLRDRGEGAGRPRSHSRWAIYTHCSTGGVLDRHVRRSVKRLRNARNSLAHRRLLPWDSVLEMV